MTPDIKARVQMQILGVLVALGSPGMPELILLRDARMQINSAITAPELEAVLREQADKRWVVSFDPLLGGKRWRITNLGESVAAEMGLA